MTPKMALLGVEGVVDDLVNRGAPVSELSGSISAKMGEQKRDDSKCRKSIVPQPAPRSLQGEHDGHGGHPEVRLMPGARPVLKLEVI